MCVLHWIMAGSGRIIALHNDSSTSWFVIRFWQIGRDILYPRKWRKIIFSLILVCNFCAKKRDEKKMIIIKECLRQWKSALLTNLRTYFNPCYSVYFKADSVRHTWQSIKESLKGKPFISKKESTKIMSG